MAAHPDLQLFLSRSLSGLKTLRHCPVTSACVLVQPPQAGRLYYFGGLRGCMPSRPLFGEHEVFDTLLTWLLFAVVREYLSYRHF